MGKNEGGRLWRGVYGREQNYMAVILGNESESKMMEWEFAD